MNVIPLMIFVSLALVTLAVLFFAFMVKEHTFEHSDRMALMPLLDDDPQGKAQQGKAQQEDAPQLMDDPDYSSDRANNSANDSANDSMSVRDDRRSNME